MATIKTNIWDLKVGDEIHFTNKSNTNMRFIVRKVTDSSCYLSDSFGDYINPFWGENFVGTRNSFGTIANLSKCENFKIIRK